MWCSLLEQLTVLAPHALAAFFAAELPSVVEMLGPGVLASHVHDAHTVLDFSHSRPNNPVRDGV